MISFEILLLGLGLAVDAGVVSFALGLLSAEVPMKHRLSRGILIALTFGFFQFLMLWSGSYGGYLLAFSSYGYLSQIIITGIFILMGLKLFQEAQKDEEKELKWGMVPLILLAIATSIDALAAGISLGTIPDAYQAAILIGIVTFIVCLSLYFLTFLFREIPHRWLLRLGGIIFICLGIRIIWHYINTGAA
ncbi:MAG: manganese efflux pump [Bdellovibrionota bacterium]